MKRLSPSRVSEIRKYWSAGYTIRHLARYFSLAESTVSGVVHRKTHRRVNAHSDLPPLPDPAHPQLVHSNRCIDRLKSGEEHSHCECSCHSWPSDVATLRQCAKFKKEGEKHQDCECHCHGDQKERPELSETDLAALDKSHSDLCRSITLCKETMPEDHERMADLLPQINPRCNCHCHRGGSPK